MRHVFISYRHGDRARVAPIVEGLRAEGLSVWWDQDLAGQEHHQETAAKLDGAAVVLAMLSPVWSISEPGGAGPWILGEMDSAGDRLIPVRIAPFDWRQMPVPLRRPTSIDLSGWTSDRGDEQWRALIHRCAAMSADVSRPVAAQAMPPPSGEPGPAAKEASVPNTVFNVGDVGNFNQTHHGSVVVNMGSERRK